MVQPLASSRHATMNFNRCSSTRVSFHGIRNLLLRMPVGVTHVPGLVCYLCARSVPRLIPSPCPSPCGRGDLVALALLGGSVSLLLLVLVLAACRGSAPAPDAP